MVKCIFLDRDGVINVERGDYTYIPDDFVIHEGVEEAIDSIVAAGFLVIVVTNQAGISKGMYSREDMDTIHKILKDKIKGIHAIYYSPYHPEQTASLSRKPDSLLFEKAIAKYSIDTNYSWMVGDRERDLVPAKKLKMKTILIGTEHTEYADHMASDLLNAVKEFILRA